MAKNSKSASIIDMSGKAVTEDKAFVEKGLGEESAAYDECRYFNAKRWAENVCYVLKARKVSIGGFESWLHMRAGQMSRYRAGTERPRIDRVFHVTEALGIDIRILEKEDLCNYFEPDFEGTEMIRALKEDTLSGKLIWRDAKDPYTYAFYNHDNVFIKEPGDKLEREQQRVLDILKSSGIEVEPYMKPAGIGCETFISKLPGSETYVVVADDEYAGISRYSTELYKVVILDMKGIKDRKKKKPEAFIAFSDDIDGNRVRETYRRAEASELLDIIFKGRRDLSPKSESELAVISYLNSRSK